MEGVLGEGLHCALEEARLQGRAVVPPALPQKLWVWLKLNEMDRETMVGVLGPCWSES